MNLDAREIAAATGGVLLRQGAAGPVVTDSRDLLAGAWFLALRGERFDGHNYVASAFAAGAGGVVVDCEPNSPAGGVVVVSDTLVALQDLGRFARNRFTGPVVGLTGSAGKTTTRALIAAAIDGPFCVHQTVGNLNNHIGVPLTLLATPSAANVLVVELGTSSPGEIGLLAEITRPTVRLVVNVGPAHLLELGGLSGVAKEKCALYDAAQPGDVAVVNQDDPWLVGAAIPSGVRRISFGEHPDADVRLESAVVDTESLETKATFATPQGGVSATLPVPGRHLALDAAAALAIAFSLGLDLHESASRLATYRPVGMRQRIERNDAGFVVINDAYNANPSSMEAALRVLADLPGRRIAVLGDMLELGADELEWHRKLLGWVLSLQLDYVVVCGPRMGAVAPPGVVACTDSEAAVAALRGHVRRGDTVLVKGSRGARMERVAAALADGEV